MSKDGSLPEPPFRFEALLDNCCVNKVFHYYHCVIYFQYILSVRFYHKIRYFLCVPKTDVFLSQIPERKRLVDKVFFFTSISIDFFVQVDDKLLRSTVFRRGNRSSSENSNVIFLRYIWYTEKDVIVFGFRFRTSRCAPVFTFDTWGNESMGHSTVQC